MGANSSKSMAIASSLDKLHVCEWQDESNTINLSKSMKSLENKDLTDFQTLYEKKKSKANNSDNNKLLTGSRPNLSDRNPQLSKYTPSLSWTEVKPPCTSNARKSNERSTVTRKPSIVYL